jgi:sulfur-oxidizing protein SoxA
MKGRRRAAGLLLPALLLLGGPAGAGAPAPIAPGELRSGFDFLGPETRAMQADDTLNPGMLWVLEGEELWRRPAGAAGRSCAGCHGDARASMKGVATRYPAFDPARAGPIDLEGRIQACRRQHQQAAPLATESQELLALQAFVAHQSRGMKVTVGEDARLEPFIARGRALFEGRQGQLDLACADCHDRHWGQRLGGSVIPQAHPTGYPLYRLEWQGVGSLQRRLRNCMTGLRADPYPFDSPEHTALQLYLMWRARGLPIETPAVRP